MQEILSVQTMRESDAAAIRGGTPGYVLMGRAAEAVAEKGRFTSPVAILAGGGGNGGDGYALALLLKDRGLAVTVFRVSDSFSPEGRRYYEQCLETGIDVRPYTIGQELSGFATIVDCLLGTGFSGIPRDPVADAIRQINCSGGHIISVDINSGLPADTGLGDTAVEAQQTISIGSLKPGHFLGRAKDCRGELVNADIGIPPLQTDAFLMEEEDAASCLPKRLNYAHKGSYAYVGLAGGSLAYSGAPRLAAMASVAMRSGAGVVSAAVPKSLCPLMAPYLLESTLFPLSEDSGGNLLFAEEEWADFCRRVRSMAFGMGIGRSEEVTKALAYVLAHYEGALVIDADGLYALSRLGWEALKQTKARVLLTPHLGEAARLLKTTAREIEEHPLASAKELALLGRCTVLLKGPATLVSDDQESWISDRGCPGMATAGSGDVLSGVLAALLGFAQGSLPKIGAAGAFLAGLAGEAAEEEMGPTAMTAGDTARQIARAVRRLEQQ